MRKSSKPRAKIDPRAPRKLRTDGPCELGGVQYLHASRDRTSGAEMRLSRYLDPIFPHVLLVKFEVLFVGKNGEERWLELRVPESALIGGSRAKA